MYGAMLMKRAPFEPQFWPALPGFQASATRRMPVGLGGLELFHWLPYCLLAL